MVKDLSIVIVNYNTKNFLKNLLSSIFQSDLKNFCLEVIVVDNNSNDGSCKLVENLKSKAGKKKIDLFLIKNKKNLGFGKASNRGAKKGKGRYILFLNSDTQLRKNSLAQMIVFMDKNKKYGAAGCWLELPDGSLDPACHRGFPTAWAAFSYFSGLERLFPRSKLFSQYHQGWKNLNKSHSIEVISGAFLMVRKKVLDKVGLFDEKFFMYGEDIDFCFRLKKAGFKIAFYPQVKVTHYKGCSGRRKRGELETAKNRKTEKQKKVRQKTRGYFYQAMKLFYNKHYQDKYPLLIRKLIMIGIFLLSKIRR